MTKTALRQGRKAARAVGFTKADTGEGPPTFSAVIAVFGNVDYQGDRIRSGAFAGSIARWASSGDPIPVVFSHQWNDLDAHVGEVVKAEELPAGHADLPDELADLGGLRVDFTLYAGPGEEPATRLAHRLDRRTIREFSFAYDVIAEEKADDGVNDLLELEILEVGPTLKGANPATQLLASTPPENRPGLVAFARAILADAKAEGFAALEPEDGTKARVEVPPFAGSIEVVLDEFRAAGEAWAEDLDAGAGGFYYLHQEATFPEELRAVVIVEGWADPIGSGEFYELTYERDEAGELTVATATAQVVEVTTSPKARMLAYATAAARKMTPPDNGKSTRQAEDPPEGKADDEGTRTGDGIEQVMTVGAALVTIAETEMGL